MQSKESIKRENFKVKSHSGITLIALVITIIVLLILAGVALSALTGDSGILNNAEKAKEKTNLANAKELLELAVQNALIQGAAEGKREITYSNLDKELKKYTNNYSIKGEEKGPWIVAVEEYTVEIAQNGIQKIILANKNGTTPWLPTGFSQVTGTTLDTGLTIANTSDGKPGTQNYVWIEVPRTISASVNGTTITLANAANETEIAAILEAYVGDYAKGASHQDYSSWKDEWYDRNGKTIAEDQSNKDDTAGCGMTYDEYKQTYEKMLNSVKKYGGFWLAQYEAGIAYEKEGETKANRTDHSAITITKANYAKDQYPYNWVYCSEAQKIANADSTEEYTSSLPFGIQWDLVCKFLDVRTSLDYDDIATNSTWGNYSSTGWKLSANSKSQYSEHSEESFQLGPKEKSSGSYLLTTGAIEATKESDDANPMNIYDFAGNIFEWTLEYATEISNKSCVYRGGFYYSGSGNVPAADRGDSFTNTAVKSSGFRSVLY